jgi:hypothetical protein
MGKNPRKTGLTVVGNATESAVTGVPPPKRLGEAGRALWRSIQAEYAITDAGGIAVLTLACGALDRAAVLQRAIEHDGATVMTRNGPKVHPAIKEELACRAYVTRTLARLGVLDEPLHGGAGRPASGSGLGVS